MDKYFFSLLLASTVTFMGNATYMQAPDEDSTVENPDSTGFVFTDILVVPTTPVKNQNKSGTCWSFAGTSLMEEDMLRRGLPETDLSEMYTVRQCYIDKAKKYVLTNGHTNFAQGGEASDLLYVIKNYGAMPEEAYPGLNYGEDKHCHGELEGVLQAYLDVIISNPNKKLTTAWLPGFIGVIDAYLGEVPETFTVDGVTYTPMEYAKAMGLNSDDFVSFTSYTHHPFYEKFQLEIPDNWLWDASMNIPIDELKKLVDNALQKGYTVAWAADVSEGGFQWTKGFALLPEKKTGEDLEGTELARWVKLSAKDREEETYKINGPVKEKKVTQESRQRAFESYDTTDDHGMVIVGIAQDQEGNPYYKVKNSWDTNQIYDGFFYVSEPYFLEKTISVLVNKEAVPSDLASKTGMKK